MNGYLPEKYGFAGCGAIGDENACSPSERVVEIRQIPTGHSMRSDRFFAAGESFRGKNQPAPARLQTEETFGGEKAPQQAVAAFSIGVKPDAPGYYGFPVPFAVQIVKPLYEILPIGILMQLIKNDCLVASCSNMLREVPLPLNNTNTILLNIPVEIDAISFRYCARLSALPPPSPPQPVSDLRERSSASVRFDRCHTHDTWLACRFYFGRLE